MRRGVPSSAGARPVKSFEIACATLSLCSSLAYLSGCSDDDGPTYVRDIQPLIATRCAGCHTEGGIAPFPLETYDQVKTMKGAISGAVAARIMPPFMAAPGCSDYEGDFSLSDAQIDQITKWVGAGAPLGKTDDTPIAVEDERLSLSRVDLDLAIPEPYTPVLTPDDYRCFLVDWPEVGTSYITGFGAEPDQSSIVHHVITYLARPKSLAKFQALDDESEGPGWPCFGGPSGNGPGEKVGWVGGWAPGGTGADFAEDTGIEVPAGSKLIVQIHYNTLTAPPVADRTKIAIRVDPTVKKRAAVMPFADFNWLSGHMDIPAHASDVMHQYDGDPTALVSVITDGALPAGKALTVYGAGTHMHNLGTRVETRIEHADGSTECMVDIPRWNFHWQLQYNFVKPKTLLPGDKIHLECHWDNPGDSDVNWGESTTDEMCLGVYYLTEAD